MLHEEDIPRSSYSCHRVVEVGRHPVLREEDTLCFASRTFCDRLTRVTLDTARYRAVCDRWCVTDTPRDIARCVTDTTQHHELNLP